MRKQTRHPSSSRKSPKKGTRSFSTEGKPAPAHKGRNPNRSRAKDGLPRTVARAPHPMPKDGLVISDASLKFVEGGHPWVVRDRDTGDDSAFKAGDIVSLYSRDGVWAARAIVDPGARIVARVLTLDRRTNFDEKAFRQLALDAHARRETLEPTAQMYRILNAESDGFPGVFLDRYGDYLVAQVQTVAAIGLAELAIEALMNTGKYRGACVKDLPRNRRGRTGPPRARWISGDPGPSELTLSETGVRYQLKPFGGYSTGIFLDQRENRALVRELSEGKKILNTFAYTGAFSLVAALGGAQVHTVDLSATTLEWAMNNFEANGISPLDYSFVAGDALEFLNRVKEPYDIVILDPPTFSTSRASIWTPGRITELNALAMRALRPDGLLMTFSNYAGMKDSSLLETLFTASREASRVVRVRRALQAGPDFPWMPGFPESRQLKGFLVEVG